MTTNYDASRFEKLWFCFVILRVIQSNGFISTFLWYDLFSEKSYFMNYDFIDKRQHLNEWIRSKKYVLEAKCLINLPSSLLRIHHITPQTKPFYFIIMYANLYEKTLKWHTFYFLTRKFSNKISYKNIMVQNFDVLRSNISEKQTNQFQ